MTREEIEKMFQYNMTDEFIKWNKAVNTEYKEENEKAFYQGAYSAQKYLVDKACKWLDDNFMNLMWGRTHSVYAGGNFASVDEMIENFRKTMEE